MIISHVRQYVVNDIFLCFKKSIAAIIKPAVPNVVQFLQEHVQHDIRCIARSTGNNDDEAVRIIHLVLVAIVNNLDQQRGKSILVLFFKLTSAVGTYRLYEKSLHFSNVRKTDKPLSKHG